MNYILKSFKTRVDPLALFEALKDSPFCFFLDSSLDAPGGRSRYSFLGADPARVIVVRDADPFVRLRDFLAGYRVRAHSRGIPFTGGAVGYFSYDAGACIDRVSLRPQTDFVDIPRAVFGIYPVVFIIDHYSGRVSAACTGFPEENGGLARRRCGDNFKKACAILSRAHGGGKKRRKAGDKVRCGVTANISPGEYAAAVKKAKEYIRAGDIYQVNLARQMSVKTAIPSADIYCRLRSAAPVPFGGYFDAGDFQILSGSPERFLSLRGRRVTTMPMKGTRARGGSLREDARLRRELLSSEKDKAELMMIVDLERNDLGRVCEYGTIKATAMRDIEEYSTVFQTTATVEGTLRRGCDGIDLVRAAFPGGSITGCPKLRAMEIIAELEPCRRSFYTGALGYIGFSGDMDWNIMIRTALKKGNTLYYGVGAGIVADSSPEAEYEETQVKARGFYRAMGYESAGPRGSGSRIGHADTQTRRLATII